MSICRSRPMAISQDDARNRKKARTSATIPSREARFNRPPPRRMKLEMSAREGAWESIHSLRRLETRRPFRSGRPRWTAPARGPDPDTRYTRRLSARSGSTAELGTGKFQLRNRVQRAYRGGKTPVIESGWARLRPSSLACLAASDKYVRKRVEP